MKRIFGSPSKYVQGAGALIQLGAYTDSLGGKALLVASREDQARVQEQLDAASAAHPFQWIGGDFQGACSTGEVARLRRLCAHHGCAVVIGLGGGRALDTAKAVAHYEQLPVIIVPTIASTDAPCSALAVIYKENGELDTYVTLRRNPDLVLADTAIIAKAPVRFLIAGMGDALSTYFEARSCYRSSAAGSSVQGCSRTALAIARACYETLKADSGPAAASCTAGEASEALDNIVEANLLMSGLAFEGCGLAAAHAVHNGLTLLEETRRFLHGEIVAFGVIVHLMLEDAPDAELKEVTAYCRSLGLPVSLTDLGLQNVEEERLMAAARAACDQTGPMGNMPVPVTPEQVYAAMRRAPLGAGILKGSPDIDTIRGIEA